MLGISGSDRMSRGTLGVMDPAVSDAWLAMPDLCERLSLTPGKVHRLVEEHALLGLKKDGVFRVPEAFLDGSEPLAGLKGTAIVLLDGGFDEASAIEWLFQVHDSLGSSPISALRQGRKTEVRRLAQTLAI